MGWHVSVGGYDGLKAVCQHRPAVGIAQSFFNGPLTVYVSFSFATVNRKYCRNRSSTDVCTIRAPPCPQGNLNCAVAIGCKTSFLGLITAQKYDGSARSQKSKEKECIRTE